MDKEITEQLLGTFNSEELTLLYKLKKADLLAQNSEYHYLLKEYDKQENVYKLLYKKEEL